MHGFGDPRLALGCRRQALDLNDRAPLQRIGRFALYQVRQERCRGVYRAPAGSARQQTVHRGRPLHGFGAYEEIIEVHRGEEVASAHPYSPPHAL